jgi:4-hydroxybenzoate polyprenyltransferase
MEQEKEETKKLLLGLDAIRNYKDPLPVAKKKKSKGWLVFWIIVLVAVALVGLATIGPLFILVIIIGWATEPLWDKLIR